MNRILAGTLWLVSLVSPRLAWWVSTQGGKLMYWFGSEAAKTTQVNLQQCFPYKSKAEINHLTQLSLAHMLLLFFEFGQLAHWSEERLLSQVTKIEGEASLREAFDSETGVLLLVPHYGNWELLCAYLGVHLSVAALYDPPKIKSLEPIIVNVRERYNGEMFPIDTGGMRGIFKTLKRGGLVAILPDQVPGRDAGVYADFYNQPALTMNLPHKLVQRSQPNVIMGSVRRLEMSDEQNQFSYCLRFEPLPLEINETDEDNAALLINQAIEEVIAEDESQYQWEYKRFKRPPTMGKDNIYRRQ